MVVRENSEKGQTRLGPSFGVGEEERETSPRIKEKKKPETMDGTEKSQTRYWEGDRSLLGQGDWTP